MALAISKENNEEKKASLSMLARFIEQGDT
jgi:hypothetical protein